MRLGTTSTIFQNGQDVHVKFHHIPGNPDKHYDQPIYDRDQKHIIAILGPEARGATICELALVDPANVEKREYGIAVCSSKDHFSRPVGRKVSFTRAVQRITKNRELRRTLWTLYFRWDQHVAMLLGIPVTPHPPEPHKQECLTWGHVQSEGVVPTTVTGRGVSL